MDRERVEAIATLQCMVLQSNLHLSPIQHKAISLAMQVLKADKIIAEEGKPYGKICDECIANGELKPQQPRLPEKWDMGFSLTIHDIATKQNDILDYIKALVFRANTLGNANCEIKRI